MSWFNQKFENQVLSRLDILRQGVDKMLQQIADFKTKVDGAFATVNKGLDNIIADEASQAKQIQDLKALIAAGTSTLDPASQAALDALSADADALVARTKAIAEAIPDTITP